LHDIQNNLQAIRMEIDLIKLESCSGVDFRGMLHAIERANLSIQDLSEYLTPPQLYFSEERAEIILEEIVDEIKQALIAQGIDVRLIRRDALPVVSIDRKQFRSALERVLKFCQALLRDGGDLEIEANLKKLERHQNVELRFIASARNPIDLEDEEVFRPFLRVNGYKVGLGMVVANDVLRRHHGTILFQKVAPNHGIFTITLQGLMEEIGLN
jgi:K+-sensing histidine kinase KdpD